jgi:hypothetical protein
MAIAERKEDLQALGSTEFRIVPSSDNRWCWEAVDDRNDVTCRGIADTLQEACAQARDAARNRLFRSGAEPAGGQPLSGFRE